VIRARTLLVAAAVTALLAGCVGAPASPTGDVLPQSVVAPLAAQLPQRSTGTPALARLGPGLVAPTNRWFSGLVFGDQPQPVFPLPLSFGLTPAGFQFGVPTVTTTPGAITAPFAPQVAVDTGSDSSVVTAYDEVAVTMTLSRAGADLAHVTVARGSPVVSYVADAAHDIRSSVQLQSGNGFYTATVDGRQFGLVAPDATLAADGMTLSLPKGAVANWFAVPHDGSIEGLAKLAADPLTGVGVSYSGSTTTLDYTTAGGGGTLFGALPQQDPAACTLGTFDTVDGTMSLCSGSRLSWSVPKVEPAASLDVSKLGAQQRAELVAQLDKDIAGTPPIPGDTYFGGKALARLANLLQLARGLGADGEAKTITNTLVAELKLWTDPQGCTTRQERCFVYDPVLQGVVGLASSFGSEQFNDHHFHYGYFLYAAAIVADGNPGLVKQFAPVMTLLAADLASGQASKTFPQLRGFDPYSGHSWASGFAQFADGNNQESSSEAVAAWNGLALWAKAAGDAPLQKEAGWLLSSEAASALSQWVAFDTTAKPYTGYDRGVVGIVWDGKLDYGTWFSAEPAAILGIQLIPMSPVSGYLAADPARIRSNVAEALAKGPAPQFADLLLMYSALAGSDDAASALQQARALPDSALDGGNSRSYLLAWIMVHA
jgi:endo-1,3(4)-beta-glucanase